MNRPKGHKNPYDEVVVVSWGDGRELRISTKDIFEAGYDAAIETLERLNQTPGTHFSGSHKCFGHNLTVFIPDEEVS